MVRICIYINRYMVFFWGGGGGGGVGVRRVWKFMIVLLSIILVLCFKGNLFIVAFIFLFVRIWGTWPNGPLIVGDEDKFILLLSTNILSMVVLKSFWILVSKLTVCNILYAVNNEANYFFRLLSWDNLWLCLHSLKILS